MRVIIAYTSKPCDGLLYYSYEHCCFLNSIGIDSHMVILTQPKSKISEYENALKSKYKVYKNVTINDYDPKTNDMTLIMGRSLLTLALEFTNKGYDDDKAFIARLLFTNKLIAVYSENHPKKYPLALKHFKPKFVYNLCDYDVYPNGTGQHFKKIINFSVYKPFKDNIKFKYLFNGVNEKYYKTFLENMKLKSPKNLTFNNNTVTEIPYYNGNNVERISTESIEGFNSHGILVLRDELNKKGQKFKDDRYNNVIIPVDNILGMFDTYVYNKEGFDPAPRLMMECKYFKKKFIFLRDEKQIDGGSAYMQRDPFCLTSSENKSNTDTLLKAIEDVHNEKENTKTSDLEKFI